MQDSMTVLERQFSALISARAVSFGDLLTLHADGDAIFIVDPESYELLHIASNSPATVSAFGPDWKGKKCYVCLQGRDEPCTYCTNHLLRRDSYHVWRHRNPVSNREYILKDKLVVWQGRELRMEKATD